MQLEDVPGKPLCSALEQKQTLRSDCCGDEAQTPRLRNNPHLHAATRLRDSSLVRVARVNEGVHVLVKFVVRFLVDVDHVAGIVIGETDVFAN